MKVGDNLYCHSEIYEDVRHTTVGKYYRISVYDEKSNSLSFIDDLGRRWWFDIREKFFALGVCYTQYFHNIPETRKLKLEKIKWDYLVNG